MKSENKSNTEEKALLTVRELAAYLNISYTTARQLLLHPSCTYVIKIRSRFYANKKALDKWIANHTGCNY